MYLVFSKHTSVAGREREGVDLIGTAQAVVVPGVVSAGTGKGVVDVGIGNAANALISERSVAPYNATLSFPVMDRVTIGSAVSRQLSHTPVPVGRPLRFVDRRVPGFLVPWHDEAERPTISFKAVSQDERVAPDDGREFVVVHVIRGVGQERSREQVLLRAAGPDVAAVVDAWVRALRIA